MEASTRRSVLVRIAVKDPRQNFPRYLKFHKNHKGHVLCSTSGLILSGNKFKGTYVVCGGQDILHILGPKAVESDRSIDIKVETSTGCVYSCRLKAIGLPAVVQSSVDKLRMGTSSLQSIQLAILEVDTGSSVENEDEPLSLTTVERGMDVFVVSSPFGVLSKQVLMNSVAKGIVSNVVSVGGNVSLMVVDCNFVHGSGGGSIFTSCGKFAGIVCGGLASTYSLGASSDSVLTWFARLGLLKNEVIEKVSSSPIDSYKKNESVLAVRIGNSWASSFAVSEQGHILTCRHILDPYTKSKCPFKLKPNLRPQVRIFPEHIINSKGIECASSNWHDASVVYVGPRGLDLAVLKINLNFEPGRINSFRPNLLFKPAYPRLGEEVNVIGFGSIPVDLGLKPFVSRGIVSKLLYNKCEAKKTLLGISTSAAVHQGNSGGIVVSTDNSRLFGMVTCNMTHTPSRAAPGFELEHLEPVIYPRMNISIAGSVLHQIIHACRTAPTLLKNMKFDDLDFSRMWDLPGSGLKWDQFELKGSGKEKFEKVKRLVMEKERIRSKL